MNSATSNDTPDNLGSSWLRRVTVIERFEESWQEHGEADVSDFVSDVPPGPARVELLGELIKVDLEYRWRRGEPFHVESYAMRFPELGDRNTLPIDLIAEEMRVRRLLRRLPTLDELIHRFPDRQAELQQFADELAADATEVAGGNRSRHALRDDLHHAERDVYGSERTTELPRRLGRYQLLERIGAGGFSTVYRARDTELLREVAVKVPRAELMEEPGALARVLREAQTAARLRHPAIVPIHEVGQHAGSTFIVYEFIRGPTLTCLTANTTPSPQQSAEWVARLAEALDYAHQNGIVHRDVKSANVMMDERGRSMLTDFGLALQSDAAATLTQHGDILGTPAYMSPEQARGDGHAVHASTDVYSLGVVLYELLCGRLPFQGSGASVLHKVIHDEPPVPRQLRANVPIDLETICLKAMAKEPGRRYATAAAMAEDLRAYLEHRPISARRLGPIGRLARWRRRNPALASTIAVAVLVLVIVTGVSFVRVRNERDRYLSERETAVAERRTAVANLYDSLVREARSARLARRTGYRAVAWDRIRQAMELETPARDIESLRQEAVACLGDFVGLEPAEWRRPSGLDGWITSVAIDPSGSCVAVAYTQVIRLREAATGRLLAEFRDHTSGVFAMAFSADGQTFVTMDDLGFIKVRSAARRGNDSDWRVTRELRGLVGAERGQVGAVSCILTPDGEYLLQCSKGEQRVRMWNIATGAVEFDFRGPNSEPFVRGAISPDGKTLAGAFRTAEMDGVVIWDVPGREFVRTLPVTRQAIVDLAFSGDGSFLACACIDGTHVFDTSDWSHRTMVRSDDQFFSVAFHPQRPIIAVPTTRTDSVRLWDAVANYEVALLEHPGGPHSVAFSPDGSLMLSATNDTVRLWNLRGGGEKRVVAAHRGITSDVRFSPDGKWLASAGIDTLVRLWDAASLRPVSQFSVSPTHLGKVRRIAFSPDGTRLAAVDWAGGATIFDVTSPEAPQRVATLVSHETQELGHILWDVAYSPDGRFLAVAGQNGVWLWQGTDRVAVLTEQAAVSVTFSPDSRLLAWSLMGGWELGLWNLEAMQPEPQSGPLAVGPSPKFFGDQNHLLQVVGRTESDRSPNLMIADVKSGQASPRAWTSVPSILSELDIATESTLSRDQTWLAISGRNVTVWDLEARKLVLALPTEPTPVNSLAFSPDRTQLAVGLTDGTIVVWDFDRLHRQLAAIGLDW
jgi:WD40 repeat protein/tRNA A-37 threonylcarbamoyl transferase component Bud32